MAKKVVATLKSGSGKEYTRVIKMTKSNEGRYSFEEGIVHKEHVKDFFTQK